MNSSIRNTTPQVNDLYESCKPALHAIGVRFGYNNEELKDLVNQFFLEMLEKEIDFSAIANPEGYVATAFKRKLIDFYRNNKQKLHSSKLYVVENAYEPSVQEAIEKIQGDKELIEKIKMAYNKLPARCRKVIFLKYYNGATTDEIAEQTGCSKRTVYNNLFTGITTLRNELAALQQGSEAASLMLLMTVLISIFII
ncbi:MAG: sigma-70 family RNA polymerase sigma factor [Bacteroidota bacterium]